MKQLRIFLSVLAALLMVVTSAAAQPAPPLSTTKGAVNVTDAGAFNVYVCPHNTTEFKVDFWGPGRRDPKVTSSEGEDTHGRLSICYIDSKAYRAEFHVTVKATDFESITPGVAGTIGIENLTMYRTYSIARRNFQVGVHTPGVYEGTMYSVSPLGESPARAANAADPNLAWPPNATLTEGQTISRAESGSGISQDLESVVGNQLYTASQTIFMGLHVPAGTPSATYQTTLTLTVVPGAP